MGRTFKGAEYFSYLIGMEVEFRTTIDDYLTFYKYFFFWRKLWLRILCAVWFSFVVANSNREGHSDISWGSTLLTFGVTTVFIIAITSLIPYLRTIRKIRKILEAPEQLDPMKMILTADGFTVSREGEAGTVTASGSWRWESVKYVDSHGQFVFIMLVGWKVFLIPRSYFHAESEIDNFVGIIRNGKARVRGTSQESDQAKARRIAPWGFVGLLPNFGVIAGIVLLYQGIVKYKSRLLIIIGVADILFTIVFWAVIQHWVFNGPVFIKLDKEMSQKMLNTVFKSVEFYKIQHGHYPDSLKQIEDIQGYVWISDPLPHKGGSSKGSNYYYQKTGDKYWLFSVGEDGQPFTADDIYPAMNPADSTKFGLKLP